jgi:hypothetical protein
LRKPYRDGTCADDMDPLSLLCRLATSIHPPPPGRIRRWTHALPGFRRQSL